MCAPAHTPLALVLALLAGLAGAACSPPAPAPAPPNLLLVVWDTVRADRLSLYGHPVPTTPRLERLARDALVFEGALAVASSTVPNHASLFTGLLPTEHGAFASHQWLEDRWLTLAELLSGAGYRTYLWAANPHLTEAKNFTQGFERAEHPWSPRFREAAVRIVRDKIPPAERVGNVWSQLGSGEPQEGALKAAGELASRGLLEFLEEGDGARPWFAFLNYMEAHRHYLPPPSAREGTVSEAQQERWRRMDRSWPAVWDHTFGLRRYTPEELDAMAAIYDATLRELDGLLAALLDALREAGQLENTVVALTSDHGELLGEHGLLDHQYSLYQPLIHVPLVLYAPGRIAAGRSDAPVMAMDLFPTLLELAGVEPPQAQRSRTRSLLDPARERARLVEYPAAFARPLETARQRHPDADLSSWRRRLRALEQGGLKLIEGEDGSHELYDLAADPQESRDLSAERPADRERLHARLLAIVGELRPAPPPSLVPEPGEEERRMLEELGYGEATPGDARDFDAHSSWSGSPGS